MTRADRIAGCLYGAAIGDALGSAFEFVDSGTIERRLGEPIVREYRPALHGSLLYPRAPGQPTDDTAMALSVAGTIASGESLTPDLFARRFLRDLDRRDGRFGAMFWGGGPGGATTRALSRLKKGADPAACGHPEDGGNGAAMRVHPVGFLADRDAVLGVAATQARVTHGHPAAIAAAEAVAVTVYDALDGVATSLNVPAGIAERYPAGFFRAESRRPISSSTGPMGRRARPSLPCRAGLPRQLRSSSELWLNLR
jgi:ADP-ribosylglycohydrolase